jgi:polyisoprenyl-phosphate glycosyltransferase
MGVNLLTAPILAIVVPCFNEAAVLSETSKQLQALLIELIKSGAVDASSRVWFVDDGSRDGTWSIVESESRTSGSRVCGIKLSRNRGHQSALLAGLMVATGDALVSVDADLQDDLGAIAKMVDAFRRGSDIVYGVRSARTSDTMFKRATAEGYYRVLSALGVEVVFNHADYRLMSRRAVEALRSFPESNLFLRALIPQLGFRSTIVEYERKERFAGESKYPLSKMLALAWQGISSFSTMPLRAITALGFLVSLTSLGMGFWALAVRMFTNDALPGWASIVIPIFLISGVQLLALGVIGEYLAKVFMETKRRPHYFIEVVCHSAEDLSARQTPTDMWSSRSPLESQ